MRTISRCKSCGERIYPDVPGDNYVCLNCVDYLTGTGKGSETTMKKSEAIKKIKDYNSILDPYDDREYEEQILWFMEEILGMLPPTDACSLAEGQEPKWEEE